MEASTNRALDQRPTIDVHNPADSRLVGKVIDESAESVAEKALALRQGQGEWEALGHKGRARWLFTFQSWLLDHSAHIADVLQSETGKPRAEAEFEVPAWVDLINYFARNAGKFLADERPRPHSPLGWTKTLTTTYRPYPLVGVIAPWNFPLAMAGLDVPPALMAGAAVLLKPSEVTPLSALELARGWDEIGAPKVFAVATGRANTGGAVVDTVDYVQFTGSTSTGRSIARRCVEQLKPYSLELGGKDPALVLADADVDRAAHGIAWGALFNAGQVCVSVERVYVEAPVYDEFVSKLTQRVRELRQGQDDRGFRFDTGPMANMTQRDIVQRHVDEAIAAGARATIGGKPTGRGTFFEPTVLIDVNQSMSCIQEETFGPTIPVIKVADEDEAIRLANDSRYGLSASVWTRDQARGRRVARKLDAGAVNINDTIANLFSFALPMGGWKQSGVGSRWGGAAGVRKYCRQTAITEPRLPPVINEPMWFPYSKTRIRLAFGAMRAIGAQGLRRIGLSKEKVR
ncbi:aldehyde dehydrogenase family protein [Mycobacteroides franklinii]|uniref:Putative succinate-semialdehyde dehydrogenase [NADP(+)] 2 n=1 Tax=Mycobacteroides franklinii TaxID=948102 RepID=A0A4R8QXP2_9MYCO|nr:aldehyde dehydrogenase family protein [Mycobacteroides franklinii]TDZ45161.1 putative succinate-semialdehyde dehydrogenase [NADP(+)] 2 [Mycobacteroides franklinii]TDZ48651.1 putative succinate-semialdehyde dehydrogenase [NADP(+)] 2 [Mycobacteroides franklinii]TDZ58832.1 putative succinate-semialdehyde dehydrogenase [NADP(+)] 2 [Mycobacteroides franklinii]TDZ66347.1 putative succinate-semialdehyde dehydrogenase [NADP(+)] 2 [Mycobacteroides franklinii]TDZ72270.1 putative succinate-semialdehyd